MDKELRENDFAITSACILSEENYQCQGNFFKKGAKQFGIGIKISSGSELESEIEISTCIHWYPARLQPPITIWEDEIRKEVLFDEQSDFYYKIPQVPDAITKLSVRDRFYLIIVVTSIASGQKLNLRKVFNITGSLDTIGNNQLLNSTINEDMKFIESAEMIQSEVMSFSLPGSSTTDGTSDGGALDLFHRLYPNVPKHFTTRQAVDNLISGGSAVKTINGHGNIGRLITGGGPNGNYANALITYGNRSFWEPMLRELSGTSLLYIYSCKTGASRAGAYLLHAMAVATGATVSAPTGLLYLRKDGTFYLEEKSTWQTATPNMIPSPIEPPRKNFVGRAPKLKFFINESFMDIDSTKMSKAEINVYSDTGNRSYSLQESRLYELTELIDFDHPFTPSGIPLAEITAIIKFQTFDGIERQFSVLADSLLRDDLNPDVYYQVDDFLGQFLRQ